MMYGGVEWNRVVYGEFLRLSILTEFQKDVLDKRVLQDMPIYRIAMELNCSESSVNRALRDIWKEYDSCQFISPILPYRSK